MTIETCIQEGLSIIADYKQNLGSMDRSKVQIYRDNLSALTVTLATYMSDYYDEYLLAEMRRKIFEAKETERLTVEKVSSTRAGIQARANSEAYYLAEVEAEKKFKRCQILVSSWNQMLNSFASRMHENK